MEQWVKISQLLFTHLASCMTAVATGRAHTCVRESALLRVEKQPENCHCHLPSQLRSVHPPSCSPSLLPNAEELEQHGQELLFH